MRNWMKQLGTWLSLAFTLGVSSAALAYPPQCWDVGACSDSCEKICYYSTYRTTCADWEVCVDAYVCGGNGVQASPSSEEAQEQQDASRDVCTEQAQESGSSEN